MYYCSSSSRKLKTECNYSVHVPTVQLKSKLYLQLKTGWSTIYYIKRKNMNLKIKSSTHSYIAVVHPILTVNVAMTSV